MVSLGVGGGDVPGDVRSPDRARRPLGLTSLGGVVRWLGRYSATLARETRTGFSGAVRPALTVAGLVLFTLAAWSVAFGLGLFVGGLCCIFLEFLLTPDDANPGADPHRTNRSIGEKR